MAPLDGPFLISHHSIIGGQDGTPQQLQEPYALTYRYYTDGDVAWLSCPGGVINVVWAYYLNFEGPDEWAPYKCGHDINKRVRLDCQFKTECEFPINTAYLGTPRCGSGNSVVLFYNCGYIGVNYS